VATADSNTLATYQWGGSSWSQTGNSLTIVGNATSMHALSSTQVALINGNGYLNVYEWDGSDWSQVMGDLWYVGTSGSHDIAPISSTALAIMHSESPSRWLQHLDQTVMGSTVKAFWSEGSGSDIYFDSGNVGIGNTNPSYVLDVTGQARLTGGYTTSDQRWKKDIKAYTNGLKAVISLRPVTYEWRADEFPDMHFPEGSDLGLIAQEVRKVLPELVSEDKDGYLSIEYGKLAAVVIEAVKELKSEKDEQLRRGDQIISGQETEIQELLKRVESLEARIQVR
jgi:hypothetical protein